MITAKLRVGKGSNITKFFFGWIKREFYEHTRTVWYIIDRFTTMRRDICIIKLYTIALMNDLLAITPWTYNRRICFDDVMT